LKAGIVAKPDAIMTALSGDGLRASVVNKQMEFRAA
jgi:hypothetical protein